MYEPYGIHKKIWNKYKDLVIKKSYDNIDLKKEFNLDNKQVWFLFDKLLQGKYDYLYKRDNMDREKIRVGDYVYCQDVEYGRGTITKIFNDSDLMIVKFDIRDLPIMCSQSGYTVHDDIKRKITKL